MRKPGRRCRSTKAGNKENKNLVGQITIGDSRVRIPSALTLVADLSLDKQMLQDVLRKKP